MVLIVSFAIFMGGVAVLSLERGMTRSVILALVFAGLLGIAGWQTIRNLKKKNN